MTNPDHEPVLPPEFEEWFREDPDEGERLRDLFVDSSGAVA